ncbi:MAG: hypothetical protein RLY35_805 [Bacteroidota bacterium]
MKKIALFTPSKQTYSETFIQLHIEGLDKVLWVYHGGEQPKQCNEVPFPTLSKWRIRFYNWRWGKRWGWEQWSLYLSLRENKPDCVYLEYGTTAVANHEVIQMLQIPMVVNFHGFDLSVYEILRRNEHRYRALIQDPLLKFVVVSRKMQHRWMEMGADAHRILYSPCGANISFAQIQSDPNAKQFVMLGRMVEKKSPMSTLQAFHQVFLKDPEVRLAVIGSGPLLTACEDYVLANDLQNNVRFHGVLDREHIQDVFSKSCCFVQHSVVAENGDEEGTPVAVMEAMLAGLLVVSTRHAGIADIVHPESGYLVEEHDVIAMAEAMHRVILHPQQSKIMAAHAKEFILAHHTSAIHLRQINDFLI